MQSKTNKPTFLYWFISVIGLIWNLMGVDAYINQVYRTERFKDMYTESQLEIINNLPVFYTIVFTVAVFASVLGCVFLLLRKKIATYALLIALIAIIIQVSYNLFLNEGKEMYGTMEYSMLFLIPLFGLILFWNAKNALKKGYLS